MDRQSRLLLVLVAVLVGLVALDRWWEPDDPMANPNATALVWSVAEDDVQRVEARRDDGATLVAEKTDDGWQLVEPIAGRANQRVVGRMVRVLAEVEHGEPIEVGDPEPFGLGDPPRGTIDLTLADGTTHHLDLGRAAPSGWRTYVRGADGVAVIDGELENAVFLGLDELRDRHLIRYDAASIRSVTIASDEGTLVVEGADRDWWVKGFARADLDAVEGLVAGLLDLQVDTFLDEALPDGIPTPVRVVTLTRDDGEPIRIRVGEATPIGQLVQVEGGVTGAVPPGALAFLGQGPTDAADGAAFPVRQTKPTAARVQLGEASWSVTFGDNGWSRTGEPDRDAFDAMEILRSVPAHYSFDPPTALGEVWGEVALTTPEGEVRVVQIGAVEGDYRIAQDGDVRYRVPIDGLTAVAGAFAGE